MNLYIPAIGTRMVLTEPWTFKLWYEDRNSKFVVTLREHYTNIPPLNRDPARYWINTQELCDFTLPAGAELSLSRIYVRKGQKDFDSASFNVKYDYFSTLSKVKIKGRFWAKLADVNKIKMQLIP